jgi:hypothetical protein
VASPKPIKGAAARIKIRPYLTDALSNSSAYTDGIPLSNYSVCNNRVWFMHCFVRRTGRDGIMWECYNGAMGGAVTTEGFAST